MTSAEYLSQQYASNDRLAVIRLHEAAGVVQHIKFVKDICSPMYQKSLRDDNDHGWNIHYSPNIIKPGRTHRTKDDFGIIAAVWADLDYQGQRQLERMWDAGSMVPKPNYVINTSPDHYQAVWRVRQFQDPELAERVMRGIAMEYGADPQATDFSHTLRLPGFRNAKAGAGGHLVEVSRTSDVVNLPEDFRVRRDIEHTFATPGLRRDNPQIESQRTFLGDWRVAHTEKRIGHTQEEARAKVQERAESRGWKQAHDYAQRTVARAYAHER